MGNLFEENLAIIGEPLNPLPSGSGAGSSDIGNVSQVIPTIHPYISICEDSIAGHSIEFERASVSDRAHEAMLSAAKALAMTAIDLFTNPDIMKKVTEEFRDAK
jgi:metal-dependent amidase/aminoacylase/carboxypeptidase family protein